MTILTQEQRRALKEQNKKTSYATKKEKGKKHLTKKEKLEVMEVSRSILGEKLLHIGKKAPKGFEELPGGIHLGKGIWVLPIKPQKENWKEKQEPKSIADILKGVGK